MLRPVPRRPPSLYQQPPAVGWDLFERLAVARLASVDGEGRPMLRTLHVVPLDGALVFHGGPVGEKIGAVGRPAVLACDETVVTLPSHFFDPERACPATTYYRSAMAWGEVEEVEGGKERARVLEALMHRLQPEGGYAPIDPDDVRYASAVAKLAVLRLRPSRLEVRFKLGQNKSAAVMERVLEGLWQRGAPGDLAALEAIREAHPETLRPGFLERAGYRFVVAPDGRHVNAAVDLVADEYWNVGVPRRRLIAAHQQSAAWVVATDEGGVVATARATSDGGKNATIYDVGVRADARRQGIGSALLRLLLDHPALRPVWRIFLGTRDAMPFYARLGFEERASRFVSMVRYGERAGSDSGRQAR